MSIKLNAHESGGSVGWVLNEFKGCKCRSKFITMPAQKARRGAGQAARLGSIHSQHASLALRAGSRPPGRLLHAAGIHPGQRRLGIHALESHGGKPLRLAPTGRRQSVGSSKARRMTMVWHAACSGSAPTRPSQPARAPAARAVCKHAQQAAACLCVRLATTGWLHRKGGTLQGQPSVVGPFTTSASICGCSGEGQACGTQQELLGARSLLPRQQWERDGERRGHERGTCTRPECHA